MSAFETFAQEWEFDPEEMKVARAAWNDALERAAKIADSYDEPCDCCPHAGDEIRKLREWEG